jgi:hypothetical protein
MPLVPTTARFKHIFDQCHSSRVFTLLPVDAVNSVQTLKAMHQDMGGVGAAVPNALQEYRVHTLKEMGANAWRCAHNPPTAALLAATDKLGMVVMVENRRFGPADNYDAGPGHNAAPPVNATQILTDVAARCAFSDIQFYARLLEDAIGSHTCSLEANMRVTNIPLGSPLSYRCHHKL